MLYKDYRLDLYSDHGFGLSKFDRDPQNQGFATGVFKNTPEIMQLTLGLIGTWRADLGGTEMLAPFKTACAMVET